MQKHRWVRRVNRVLRQDLTLVAVAGVSLVVSASVLLTGRHEPLPVGAVAVAASGWPTEEDLAGWERPAPETAVLEVAPPETLHVLHGTIAKGQALARALAAQGVEPELVHRIDRGLRPIFDFRKARPGQSFWLTQDAAGDLLEFRYQTSALDSYVLRREGTELVARREEVPLRPQVARMAGIVATNVHDAVVQLGERSQLAHDFSEIFAWDIDFSREVRRGDEFRILYERLYRDDPQQGPIYVRPGRILAARYAGKTGDVSAVYFEPEEGRGGYYRPDGSSVESHFLQAPLRYSRISSAFTSARFHPILKTTRPHHGIDYAAPAGTPLWSVANGKVIYRGWAGGYGNLVKIRHEGGYVSYYAHLSKFAAGLRVGQSVQQKQVIGYVGATGLATGPHVCFRLTKDGRYLDPAQIGNESGPPVSARILPTFRAERDVMLAQLESGPLLTVDEAL
jgi:murein DD-endopeptidase MepM/ murein hydrolase activator NlpD